jgi:hypothetical protein
MFAEVKGGWCVELQTYYPYVPIFWKSWNPNFMEPSASVQGLCRDCFTFNFTRGMRMINIFPGRFGPEEETPEQIGQEPLTLPFLFQVIGLLTLRTRFSVKKLIVPKLLIENEGSLSC